MVLDDYSRKLIYPDTVVDEINKHCDLLKIAVDKTDYNNLDIPYEEINILFTGWGSPQIDRTLLIKTPNLKIVFHGGGTIRGISSEDLLNSNIKIVSMAQQNAIPVAYFTLSQILFSLKTGWQYTKGSHSTEFTTNDIKGFYQSTVGLISYGIIARKVRDLLPPEIRVNVYDPYVSEIESQQEKINLVSLKTLFKESDVISLHAPDIPETYQLVRKEHFALMKPNATFINTARSRIVNHSNLIEIFSKREDLFAVLDVLEDTSQDEQTTLSQMRNIAITPHIAGSLGNECSFLGHSVVQELIRFCQDEPLQHEVTYNKLAITA